jgi:hypothetical protein
MSRACTAVVWQEFRYSVGIPAAGNMVAESKYRDFHFGRSDRRQNSRLTAALQGLSGHASFEALKPIGQRPAAIPVLLRAEKPKGRIGGDHLTKRRAGAVTDEAVPGTR